MALVPLCRHSSSASSWLLSAFLFYGGLAHSAEASVADLWHVQGNEIVSQELEFSNADANLVGTVYLPKKGDHLPAVVALHSAAAGKRDAGLYRHLLEGLPEIGFAVLIYDRRGSGQSTGSLQSANYETLAEDAIAGQRALSTIHRIDPAKIGFWGLSQGGWLSVIAASRSPSTAFAISVSAPLVTADEQMQFATTNRLMLHGYSASAVRDMLDARAAWTGYLRGTASHEQVEGVLQNAQSKPWFELSYLPKPADLPTGSQRTSSREQLDDDPSAAISNAKVPLLFLYGDSDPWVPVAKSLDELQLIASRQHNVEYHVVPEANHEMMSPIGERMEVSTEAPQAPAYFVILGAWLAGQVK